MNVSIQVCMNLIFDFIGKFQMQVLSGCGHAVHEDVPDKVCSLEWQSMCKNTINNSERSLQ